MQELWRIHLAMLIHRDSGVRQDDIGPIDSRGGYKKSSKDAACIEAPPIELFETFEGMQLINAALAYRIPGLLSE